MIKVLVIYYSMYGHVKALAESVAAGARSVPDVTVDIHRVPELMPADIFEKSGGIADSTPVLEDPNKLAEYDAILFGTPTRFGNMAAQMRNFLDRTGGLWMKGSLIGKVGSVFCSTGTGGGNETTITSFYNTLIHHGMIISGLPYSCLELVDISERLGGSPYGAATFTGHDGKRMVHEKEHKMGRFQGEHVAKLAAKLK